VTVTANDTAENIRVAAGFDTPDDPEADPASPSTETAKSAGTIEREEDGKFKAKTPEQPEPAKPARSGDPRKSHQAKIDVAIAKQREAERERDDARRIAAEREAEIQALRQPAQPRAESEPVARQAPSPSASYLQDVQRYQALPNAPKFDDFVNAGVEDPYTMHQAAMAAFIADTRDEERQARRAEQAHKSERDSQVRAAISLGAERHPDFQQLLNADPVEYSPVAQELLREEARFDPALSADLFHHLLTHPDDANRLAKMTDSIAAAREIGRLVAQVSSALSGPETLPVSTTAKPLIKPVRPSVMAAGSASPDDLPFGPKYIAAMNEQERKAREARHA